MPTEPTDAPATEGIHHVTAVAGDPAENARFYREELGLRLVKRTVNFDDPSTYHLYYGDEVGTPGTILTFFPFGGGRSGTPGRGQATATAFVVPEGSLDYWVERFEERGVSHGTPTERLGERVLVFADADGQPLELVEGDSDVEPWDGGDVPAEHAVRGFHGVTLHPTDPEATGAVLETLGFEATKTTDDRIRYVAGDRADERSESAEPASSEGRSPSDHSSGRSPREDGERQRPARRASVVDVLTGDGPRGRPGPGTIHHVAFRVTDDDEQAELASAVSATGVFTTPQKDRQYFRSVYFREPGGVLFELATEGPGFAIDESVAELGTSLKLPPWLEDDREPRGRPQGGRGPSERGGTTREQLEAALPPLDADGGGTDDADDGERDDADAEVDV